MKYAGQLINRRSILEIWYGQIGAPVSQAIPIDAMTRKLWTSQAMSTVVNAPKMSTTPYNSGSMPIVIRLATAADIPTMAAIRAREWQTDEFWTDRIGRYLGGEHSPQKALAERAVFVAIDDTSVAAPQVIGFIAGHRTERFQCDGELQWVDVAAERRRQGIAAMLMPHMGAWFFAQGARRICVNVEADNLPARRLYARFGATPFQDSWMLWEDAQVITELRTR